MNYNLTNEDQIAIFIFWLTLLSLGFEIQDQDLSEPGYMRYDGAHTIYTFSVLLCDDEDFPVEQFRDMLAQYAAISPEIKPQFWGIEEYPAQMRNFSLVYVSVFVSALLTMPYNQPCVGFIRRQERSGQPER